MGKFLSQSGVAMSVIVLMAIIINGGVSYWGQVTLSATLVVCSACNFILDRHVRNNAC